MSNLEVVCDIIKHALPHGNTLSKSKFVSVMARLGLPAHSVESLLASMGVEGSANIDFVEFCSFVFREDQLKLNQKIKLYGTGYGSQMRFMLALASERGEVEWEDLCYKWETFQTELKPKGMSMPLLELADGTSLTGMYEIAEFIAKRYGFWPDEDSEQGKELGRECERLVKEFAAFTFPFLKPLIAQSRDESAAETQLILENTLPQYIAKVEEALERKGSFFLLADDKLYCCDFFAAKFFVDNLTNQHCALSNICGDIVDAHPRFKAYGEAFAAANKTYLENGGVVNPDACP